MCNRNKMHLQENDFCISCPVWQHLCTKRLISLIFLSNSPFHFDGQRGLHPMWFTSCQMGFYLLSMCYFPLIQSVIWKIISRNKATSGSVCDAVHDSCPLERTINAKRVHKQTQTRKMSSNGCSALPALIWSRARWAYACAQKHTCRYTHARAHLRRCRLTLSLLIGKQTMQVLHALPIADRQGTVQPEPAN